MERMPPCGRAVLIVGQRISEQRARCGFSQAELAQRAGCSECTISSIESGGMAYHTTVKRIASALGVPPDVFIVPGHADTGLLDPRHLSVQLTLNLQYSTFDETHQLISLLRQILSHFPPDKKTADVEEVKEGSEGKVSIHLHFEPIDPLEMITLLEDADFANFEIVKICAELDKERLTWERLSRSGASQTDSESTT